MDAQISAAVLSCIHCGNSMSWIDQYVGTPVACPYCGNIFVMPSKPSPVNQSAKAPSTPSAHLPFTRIPPKSFYVIPRPKRPAGLTIIAVIGIFVSFVFLLAIGYDAGVQQGLFPPIAGHSTLKTTDLLISTALILGYLLVCAGLLRGSKVAFHTYSILSVLIIIGIGADIAARLRNNSLQQIPTMYAFHAALALYFLITLAYLWQKRIRNWFD